MKRITVHVFAVLVSGLAVAGLFTDEHLFNLMNVDMAFDALRVVLAADLIYVGFISKSERTVQIALAALGMLYIGMGLLGLVDSTLFGMLPSGLTTFDIGFHLASGILALGVAFYNHGKAPVLAKQ